MNSPESPNGPLPFDIMLLILSKLPIKSIFRFKSVAKSWSNVPSDPHFINLHYKNSSQNPNLLIELFAPTKPNSNFISVDASFNVSNFSLDFLNDWVKIRASSNGVLCCASVRNIGVYYVCNPMTREFRSLPRTRDVPFTRVPAEYESTFVGIASNPIDYKFNVVLAGFCRPLRHHSQQQLVCLVFDSVSNSWSKSVAHLHEESMQMNPNQVVFCNGALYWLTVTCSHIFALDLADLVWRKISMPDETVGSGFGGMMCLLELEGLVSLIQITGDCMSIWVLKDYWREEWVLEDRVHLRCIRGCWTSVCPISQSKDVVFLSMGKKFLTYARKNKVWREISTTYPLYLWFSALSFRSTLFPCH